MTALAEVLFGRSGDLYCKRLLIKIVLIGKGLHGFIVFNMYAMVVIGILIFSVLLSQWNNLLPIPQAMSGGLLCLF